MASTLLGELRVTLHHAGIVVAMLTTLSLLIYHEGNIS